MHCFSFDIETVPDVEFGRRFWDLDGLPDDEVATAMMFKRIELARLEDELLVSEQTADSPVAGAAVTAPAVDGGGA